MILLILLVSCCPWLAMTSHNWPVIGHLLVTVAECTSAQSLFSKNCSLFIVDNDSEQWGGHALHCQSQSHLTKTCCIETFHWKVKMAKFHQCLPIPIIWGSVPATSSHWEKMLIQPQSKCHCWAQNTFGKAMDMMLSASSDHEKCFPWCTQIVLPLFWSHKPVFAVWVMNKFSVMSHWNQTGVIVGILCSFCAVHFPRNPTVTPMIQPEQVCARNQVCGECAPLSLHGEGFDAFILQLFGSFHPQKWKEKTWELFTLHQQLPWNAIGPGNVGCAWALPGFLSFREMLKHLIRVSDRNWNVTKIQIHVMNRWKFTFAQFGWCNISLPSCLGFRFCLHLKVLSDRNWNRKTPESSQVTWSTHTPNDILRKLQCLICLHVQWETDASQCAAEPQDRRANHTLVGGGQTSTKVQKWCQDILPVVLLCILSLALSESLWQMVHFGRVLAATHGFHTILHQ